MMIDRVYQTVKMLANTEVRGNMKPQDFDKALYNVMLEKIEEYPFELNRALNRQNRGLIGNGLENIPDNIIEKMQHFSEEASLVYTASAGTFTIPTNVRDIDAILHLKKNEIVLAKNTSQFNHIANFKHTAPTTEYPIGLRLGNKLKVLPITINTSVTMYYLRNPLLPKWTYVLINDAEIFNPSAGDFQDIDMHPSEEDDIISRLCVKFGINLKEPDLQNSAANSEQQEFNNQNMN
jgi:hypothetical protein